MAFFAVRYVYDATRDIDAVRPRHREYLATLNEAGSLKASGPFIDTEEPGGLLIFQADSSDDVAKLLNDDPMYAEGIVIERLIRTWNLVIGVFADQRD